MDPKFFFDGLNWYFIYNILNVKILENIVNVCPMSLVRIAIQSHYETLELESEHCSVQINRIINFIQFDLFNLIYLVHRIGLI